MHHFPAEKAAAHFAEHSQSAADLERGYLARVKMQEAQGQLPAGILQPANQRLARPVLHFSVDDFAFDLHLIAAA